MSRHLADKRSQTSGGRIRAFMRLARENEGERVAQRGAWHRDRHDTAAEGASTAAQARASSSRLVHFLRIARGHLR